jgi:hypothetical protein
MDANELKDLLLAIVTGQKTDATQIEHNVAASYVREITLGSAEWVDALYDKSELHVISKDVDGQLFVLTSDQSTFEAFDSNAGEPWIITDLRIHDIDSILRELGDVDARVMPLEEAMNFVHGAPKP